MRPCVVNCKSILVAVFGLKVLRHSFVCTVNVNILATATYFVTRVVCDYTTSIQTLDNGASQERQKDLNFRYAVVA
jgi:hypothetical protein